MKYMLLSLLSLMCLFACRTSGDVARGKDYVDPTEVKTETEAPAAVKEETPAHEDLSRQLAIVLGENETLKATHKREILVLAERIAFLEDENKKLKESAAQNAVVAEEQAPKNDVELWNLALKNVQKQNYEKSAQNFEMLMSSYPKSAYLLHAHLGRAMSLYGNGDVKESALVFNQIIDRFPKRKEVSLAWFSQGCAFFKMGQRQDAKLFFTETTTRFPKTEEAGIAKLILAQKKRPPSDLFLAFPGWAQYAPQP